MSSPSSLCLCAPPPFRILNQNALRRTTAIKQQARLSPRVRCAATDSQPPARRSANYQPSFWTGDYVRSLTSNHAVEEEDNATRINILKESVKNILIQAKNDAEQQLQLIDHLQQLGVAYHFKDEIKDALGSIHASLEDAGFRLKDDLHATALLFRLLRENGFPVPEDILKRFIDENGNLKAHCTRGMLSLYEASFYGKEGELLLDKAMDLTTKHLRWLMETEEGSSALLEADADDLREHVAHALEIPLNWRMQRLQTRWFIRACERKPTVNPLLLELAKLDFNAVQKIYRREVAELSRWWEDLDLPRNLPFFRDRLLENYLFTVGWAYEPEHWGCSDLLTKGNCFITMIDDVYDVYGTLNELELFTNVMDGWDVNAIDKLPEYMKICFLAIFNTENAAAYRIMKEKGLDIIPYVRRAWANLCKGYLVEAKWYNKRYTPKLDEYLDNAWLTIGGEQVFIHAYCMNNDLTKEALESFSSSLPLVRSSSILYRLHNDLATSPDEIERGDVPKSIQCCMHERKVSEATARLRIKELMMKKYWKQLNGDRTAASSFEEKFKNMVVNVPRTAQFFYQHGDGYGKADGETKNQIFSLLIEPIKP